MKALLKKSQHLKMQTQTVQHVLRPIKHCTHSGFRKRLNDCTSSIIPEVLAPEGSLVTEFQACNQHVGRVSKMSKQESLRGLVFFCSPRSVKLLTAKARWFKSFPCKSLTCSMRN
ncbi:hypothetical protein DUNSADRAFT_10591 [Dunaliella salina]|uniref:Uncharacterized protein n=1 Tax=Dunaliella salina TaxID=3046 RepID=A0ABQ7H4U4_DUNSA|nr:hypothetical protein DUNSADRAFT_10591 [Dunaliella salina]|eukprot:KAF5841885.1 hypothetical protein DUNSADRAFT_10591 [Dunaliella salina]